MKLPLLPGTVLLQLGARFTRVQVCLGSSAPCSLDVYVACPVLEHTSELDRTKIHVHYLVSVSCDFVAWAPDSEVSTA